MRKSVSSLISVVLVAGLLCLLSFQPAVAKTLRWAFSSDVASLDPYSFDTSHNVNFARHIHDALLRLDLNLKVEPCLATSWKAIEPTVWRFSLRKGVKFHNGNPFTADDVVASIKRVTHPNSPLKGLMQEVKDTRKVDDYTIDIVCQRPAPLLPNILTSLMIMDKEWMTEHNCLDPIDPTKGQEGYASTHTNGTGPFMLESRQPDAKTVLVVNPNWWDTPRHNLTRIVFTPIKSDATRVAALLSGEIDFIHPSPLQDAERISRAPGFKLIETPSIRTIMLMINQEPSEANESNIKGKNPLKDVRVRRALYQAIDMEAIRTKIMRGKSRNTGLFVAPEIRGYDPALDKRLPFDPDAAKRLLADAGYPDGFEIGFDAPNDRYTNDEKIAQAIVPMWARIGIKAGLTVQPGSNLLKKRSAKKSDIWMVGFATVPMFDAYHFLSNNLATQEKTKGFYNPGGFSNPRVDELTEKVAVELDEEKRLKMISEALKLAQDDCVIIPLHQQPIAWAIRDNVKITQIPDDTPRLYWTSID